jgi:hypothetical protein
MALHKIDNASQAPRCEICGEPTAWTDKEVHDILTPKGSTENIGTGKGLVYATCDAPKCPLKVYGKGAVCQHIANRPKQDQAKTHRLREIRDRFMLPYPYKGMDSCMTEGLYTKHDGKVITFQCCRNENCMNHFFEQGRKLGQQNPALNP